MNKASSVQTLSIPQVPASLVMNFVRDTPEGTLLWNALCEWRHHYEEKRSASLRLEKLKNPTKTQKEATTEFHKARNRLKRSYKAAVAAFNTTIANEFVRQHHPAELAAIATELGLDFTVPQIGEQLALQLNS